MDKERKSIVDFCYILMNEKSIELKKFLKVQGINQINCGLRSISHMRDCYNLYYSKELNYSGIIKNELSNDVNLSSIPKEEIALAMLFFNKDGYSSYCKKYREYWDWVEKRNDARYSTTISHGKNYDSKNMMHTFRLLHMAKEIAIEGIINVERADRDFLLDVKDGKFEYEELIQKAEIIKGQLSCLYEKSKLPDYSDKNRVNELLVGFRKKYYKELRQLQE
jgi:hypothetical protein